MSEDCFEFDRQDAGFMALLEEYNQALELRATFDDIFVSLDVTLRLVEYGAWVDEDDNWRSPLSRKLN